ncbi:hypothetical protein DFJ74DRAFT_676319 [Hyaloraphidium curvatum]|nr:hypothetical protein DFJ74DRAFT_676319 [Hyaloraphidium curvatum]
MADGSVQIAGNDLFAKALEEIKTGAPEVYEELVKIQEDIKANPPEGVQALGIFDSAKSLLGPLLGSASSMMPSMGGPPPSGNPYQQMYGGRLSQSAGSNPFASFMPGASGGSGGGLGSALSGFLGKMGGGGGGGSSGGGLGSLIGGLMGSGGGGGGGSSFGSLGSLLKMLEAGAPVEGGASGEKPTFEITG